MRFARFRDDMSISKQTIGGNDEPDSLDTDYILSVLCSCCDFYINFIVHQLYMMLVPCWQGKERAEIQNQGYKT